MEEIKEGKINTINHQHSDMSQEVKEKHKRKWKMIMDTAPKIVGQVPARYARSAPAVFAVIRSIDPSLEGLREEYKYWKEIAGKDYPQEDKEAAEHIITAIIEMANEIKNKKS